MKRFAAVVWPVVGTIVLTVDALLRASRGTPLPASQLAWNWFGWLEWMLLAPLVVLIAERFPLWIHALAPFAVSGLHSAIYFAARRQTSFEIWREALPVYLLLDLLVYSATVLGVYVARFTRGEQQRHSLERDLARAELDALRLRLPAQEIQRQLRLIEETITTDAREADRQIVRFSRELRTRLAESKEVEREVSEPAAGGSHPTFVRVVLIAAATSLLLRAFLQELLTPSNRTVDFLVAVVITLAVMAYRRLRRAAGVAELDARLLRTRALMLRLQLNPHFLFNVLNSIAALLEARPAAARTMATRLRHFVERVLASSDEAEVTLHEELKLLENYVAIESIRFGDTLRFEVDVSDHAGQALLPSFLLQPLVENAVHHGVQHSRDGLIRVTAAVESGALRLAVIDNGQGPDGVTAGEGIGLSNTRSRLQTAYGSDFSLVAEQGPEGFRIRLSIPFNIRPAS